MVTEFPVSLAVPEYLQMTSAVRNWSPPPHMKSPGSLHLVVPSETEIPRV